MMIYNEVRVGKEGKEAVFQEACNSAVKIGKDSTQIGTLREKTVHAAVKQYLEPRREYQEIRVLGFIADICRPMEGMGNGKEIVKNEILEIQTRNFSSLRKKLSVFLKDYHVTVVYPMPYDKWIRWIDIETGEITPKHKSPKRGQLWDMAGELYRIKDFLVHKNLKLLVLQIDMEESRLLNGWSKDRKRGSVRFDRIPLRLVNEIWLRQPMDYRKMLPQSFLDQASSDQDFCFTVKEYQKAVRLSSKRSAAAIAILKELGVIAMCGKRGRAFLYQIREGEGEGE